MLNASVCSGDAQSSVRVNALSRHLRCLHDAKQIIAWREGAVLSLPSIATVLLPVSINRDHFQKVVAQNPVPGVCLTVFLSAGIL